MLRLTTGGLVLAVALLAPAALGDTYDFQIYKLGNKKSDPNADANFRVFARKFAAGMTSVNLAPPETLGHSGFAFALEMSVVDFGKGGAAMPTEGAFAGPMLIPTVHIRKGLPWSFEIGARAGWIEKSRMGVATLELKWAVNEGFAYLPDIAIRGNITKLINTRDFDVTSGGVDLGVGKQFALGGMVTLTPYVGWNLLFVGASTGTIDFNPGRALADADRDMYTDYDVYQGVQAAQNTHNRFYGGFRFVGGVAQLALEVSYSLIGPFHDATSGLDRCKEGSIDGACGVLAFNGMIGLDF
jgi:hypothetical protein